MRSIKQTEEQKETLSIGWISFKDMLERRALEVLSRKIIPRPPPCSCPRGESHNLVNAVIIHLR